MEIIPGDACIGATVHGLSLSSVPTVEQVDVLESALERHGVLVIPDQAITPRQQVEFSRAIGEIETSNTVSVATTGFAELAEVGNVGNRPVSFAPAEPDGELEWHTDHIQHPVTSKSTLLVAKEVPEKGGDTLFACLYAAYDALSTKDRRRCDEAVAVHSASGLREYLARQGEFDLAEVELDGESDWVRWPLVRRHPLTERPALYFAAELTVGIDGWNDGEARAFIRELTAHTTQPQFVYRHEWKPNQAVLWDNRRVLHAGTWYDKGRYRRYLLRTMMKENLGVKGIQN